MLGITPVHLFYFICYIQTDMLKQDEILPNIIYSTQKTDIGSSVGLVKKLICICDLFHSVMAFLGDNFGHFYSLKSIGVGRQRL